MQIDINRQELNETVLVLEGQGGALYLAHRDLLRWRIRPPDGRFAVAYRGEKYYPLSAITDAVHGYDPKTLTLMVEIRPEAFAETVWTTESGQIPLPTRHTPGGFLNYELFAAHSQDSTQRSGQFEVGYFNRFGVGISNLLAENLGSNPHVTRLDTTWTRDFPAQRQSLRLGDAINVAGTWGRSVRFGGIQYGTNYATQPGFVTFPPQSAVGQAVLPSTVEVFVNNALASRQNVPPGPFSISNLPVVTGSGEVQLVVRDLLGREQLITRPFYASQALLREGLASFSHEFGFMRENFGINSNDYADWLATTTYRRGVSERFTGEVHGEAMRGLATVGAGGDYLLPSIGTFSTYFAASRNRAAHGGLALAGVDRQARPWSLGARTQWTTPGFAQVGLTPPQLPPLQLSSVNLSYAARSGGSVGIAYVMQRSRDQDDTRFATLSYSTSLGKLGSLSISAVRNLAGDATTTIFALLSFPLDNATSVSVSSQFRRGENAGNGNDFTTTVQRNTPAGEGYGYRVLARGDGSKEGSYALQNNIGRVVVEAAHNQGSSATRLDISGGVALLDGDLFLSRRIDQSFAVARIPDYPGVRILADNQPAGRTDAAGNALIPRLRAYDINVISIDHRDVPLDAEIGSLKLDAVPYYRSGIELKFPIKHSRGATFILQLEDGRSVPVGASVQESGRDEVYTVGYDGEVYVAGLGSTTRLRATWGTQSCEFTVAFSASADPLPDLGTFICIGVKP